MIPDLRAVDDAAAWSTVAGGLTAANYSTSTLCSLLTLEEAPEIVLGNIARYSLEYLEDLEGMPSATAVLARLFLFCGDVCIDELEAIPPILVGALRDLCLVMSVPGDEGSVRGTASIAEYGGNYFLSDRLFENGRHGFLMHDLRMRTMPPHASSLELLQALRKPEGAHSFLDVGCGSGFQSIMNDANYDRARGFDIDARSVAFARVNALLAGSSAQFSTDCWETFADGTRYDHVAFNAPNAASAFEFIRSKTLPVVLSETGCAQVFAVCEISSEEGDVAQAIERRLGPDHGFKIDVIKNEESPFSLSSAQIKSGILPENFLLVRSTVRRSLYIQSLIERGVAEIASVVINVTAAKSARMSAEE
jgi:SAM-dependent methyltransferase